MEKMEAMLWTGVLRRVKAGDAEAQAMLRGANEGRAKNGDPSVEEELRAYAAKGKSKESQEYINSIMIPYNTKKAAKLIRIFEEATEAMRKEKEEQEKQERGS